MCMQQDPATGRAGPWSERELLQFFHHIRRKADHCFTILIWVQKSLAVICISCSKNTPLITTSISFFEVPTWTSVVEIFCLPFFWSRLLPLHISRHSFPFSALQGGFCAAGFVCLAFHFAGRNIYSNSSCAAPLWKHFKIGVPELGEAETTAIHYEQPRQPIGGFSFSNNWTGGLSTERISHL